MRHRERLGAALRGLASLLARPVKLPVPNPERIERALAAAAPATLALGIADGVLGAAVPGGAVGDPRLDVLARCSAFACEFLALAAAVATWRAAKAVLLGLADHPRAPRPLRVALRSAAPLAVGALVLAFFASWSMLWAAGTFMDGAVLDLIVENPGQMAMHVATMNPVLLALVPVGAPAAVLAGAALRRAVERAPPRARRAAARVLVGSVSVAAGLALWEPAQAAGAVEDPSGARVSGRTYLRMARVDRTGPVVHALTWWAQADERGGAITLPGAAADPGVRVEQRPKVGVESWLRDSAEGGRKARRLNVVVLLVESLRRDVLRTFGGERDVMPAVDALARTSLRFQGHYSQATHSDYADLCPLSSQHPLRSQRHHFYEKPIRYPRVLLYDILKPLRYRTAIVSSQNERWGGMYGYLDTGGLDLFFHSESARELSTISPEDPGFDLWARTFNLAGKLDDAVTVDRAIRWIGESEQPFFLYVNLQNSHFPYRLPSSFPPRFSPHEVDFPYAFKNYPPEKTPIVVNRYHNALAYVDAQIARLLDFLRSSGRLDDTIFVLSGDTGQAFYEHGTSGQGGPLFEEVVRVPLIVHAPGLAPRDVAGPSQHVDVPPTVLELLGLPAFPGFQGRSLVGGGHGDDAVYLVAHMPAANQLGVVSDGYKLIYDFQAERALLYDLVHDPVERRDLADADPQRRAALASRLQAFARAQLGYYESEVALTVNYPPVVRSATPPAPRLDGDPWPARAARR